MAEFFSTHFPWLHTFMKDALRYWFMFPIAIATASFATSTGFGGSIIFAPVMMALGFSVPESVATGMFTEAFGMGSALIGYLKRKSIQLDAAIILLYISIPGLVIGLHINLVANEYFLRMLFGVIVAFFALWALVSAYLKHFGHRNRIDIAEFYSSWWIPLIGGIGSGVSSVGTIESVTVMLERVHKIKPHKAVATGVFVEAMIGWIATAINLSTGLIKFEVAIWTVTGVAIGGQIGSRLLNPILPEKVLKYIFGVMVLLTALKMAYENGLRFFAGM